MRVELMMLEIGLNQLELFWDISIFISPVALCGVSFNISGVWLVGMISSK